MRGTFPSIRPYRVCAAAAAGFTLIELLVVLAIVAILALIAVPGVSDRYVREQIVEAAKLADVAKAPVALSWATLGRVPVDNGEAGLPAADRIVSNYVSSVAVESGAIQLTFGNQAYAGLQGKVLSLRPGVVEGAPVVPVAWVCGHSEPPGNMSAKGVDRTTVPVRYLPLNCRQRAAASPPSP
jgi:type IV pilus assembly protein PilA